MLRLYRKTIYPRWTVKRKNSSEKKYSKPKALVLCAASEKTDDSNHDHQKKQHAHKQDKRYWEEPQFHFDILRTSIFEKAGWLGTAALCVNYHFKLIHSLDYEKVHSSCLFSNIVFALPRRLSLGEKPYSNESDSVSSPQPVDNSEIEKTASNINVLESIESICGQYVAAVENSNGVRNINKNDKKAFRSFQIAARQGSGVGFYNLGLCYHLGKGTRVNLSMAAFCYKKAVLKGHGLASFNLATFFYKGIGGLPVDTKIAEELLALAAEKNVPEAQLYFGILFLEEKKWLDAVKIFTNLAKLNIPDAQYYLGLCYENGLGVEKSETMAVELFTKSANQGNEKALKKLHDKTESKTSVQHSFSKSTGENNIEQSSNLRVSSSVPELGALLKKTNRNIVKFPILSYLNLFSSLVIVNDNNCTTKKNSPISEDKPAKDISNTVLSIKSFPFVVMQVKTQL